MVYGVNPTFNNISVISWQSVLLVEETCGTIYISAPLLWTYRYICIAKEYIYMPEN
jgi:hypothetical protein